MKPSAWRRIRDPWVWRMAWRDGRAGVRRLLLFTSCMTLGVAALVAIGSFGANLRATVDAEARTLLGADLRVQTNLPFGEETEELLRTEIVERHGADEARRISFSSMALFPSSGGTRLVRVRAVEGDYPFYGTLETDPPEAAATYRSGAYALVDDSVMHQFGAGIGDELTIGDRTYRIAGRLLRVPGESDTRTLFGPRVYLPRHELDPSLTQRGSRVRYAAFYRLPPGVSAEAVSDRLEERSRALDLDVDSADEVRRGWGRALDDLEGYLGLVGFVALLLGGLGVGSAIHVYVKQKLETVAVLRCLGANASRVFAVYLIQATAIGLLGAATGAAAGIAIQHLLPGVLAGFLPVEVELGTAWGAVARGIALGVLITLLFALLPLVSLRRIAPLSTLRAEYEPGQGQTDWLRWLVVAVLAVTVAVFAYLQTDEIDVALGFAGGVGAAFVLLAGTARLLTASARRLLRRSWPYVARQGLANLYRPHNQTLLMMVSLGLGTFLLLSLYLTQHSLLGQLETTAESEQANLVLFDIQGDQLEEVRTLIEDHGLPITEATPIVNMRLASVKGRSVAELRADRDSGVSRWALRREYRSTYRDHLTTTETLLEGSWVGEVTPGTEPVPISIEERQARRLRLEVGDEVVFDVQGVAVPASIASIREVEWRRARANFFVVFPTGVLESAPQFHVLLLQAPGPEASAALQRALVEQCPNVSAVDVSMVLAQVDELLGRVAFVIRFMALFSVLTGLAVLSSAVLTTRFQRIEESVLLRTLGASRSQVLRILGIEYALLGGIAALAGVLLSLAGSVALVLWLFDGTPTLAPGALLVALIAIPLLTVGIGLFSSRGVTRRPPLEVLRAEV